jgi:hypothetical protein
MEKIPLYSANQFFVPVKMRRGDGAVNGLAVIAIVLPRNTGFAGRIILRGG